MTEYTHTNPPEWVRGYEERSKEVERLKDELRQAKDEIAIWKEAQDGNALGMLLRRLKRANDTRRAFEAKSIEMEAKSHRLAICLEDIRDLARTGLPISGYTTSEWDTYRIHKIAGLANEALERGAK